MTLKTFLIFTLIVILNIQFSDSYNILIIFGHTGKSHYQAFGEFFIELGARGHNVTILSHVPVKGYKNVRHIPLNDGNPMTHAVDLVDAPSSRVAYYFEPQMIAHFAETNCPQDLNHHNVQNFLKEENHFDVILTEFFNTNCYYGIITKIKAPFIGLSSSPIFPWQPAWFGSPQNPAFNQVIFMGYKTPMSFFARVENTVLQIVDNFWYENYMANPGNEYSKKYIGYEAADPHNASLILVNTHHTLHGVRPLTPSIVEVGGLHVSNKKPKKLPEAIESWINNSDSGVIYFSLGSMIKGDTFPEKQRRAFARAFSRLSQRVLWKWENDTMQEKPDNVMISKWMPQFDILCHPNVKAFIAHGGLLGITEAVYCGVPIIVMPQFGDQRHNAHAVENSGSGVILYLRDSTEEMILEALHTVLNPQTYNNAKSLSSRFRDRPLSPLDTAVYWVEHVARQKGAAHMKSPAINMPFYQYFLLDVIAFLTLIVLLFSYIIFKISGLVIRMFVKSKKESKQKLS